MMDGFFMLSSLLTNELRLLLGLAFAAGLSGVSLERKVWLVSAAGGGLATFLQAVFLPGNGVTVMAAEALVIAAAAWYALREKCNVCLFLAISYEIGIGLWDFLLQAGLGILFRSEDFAGPAAPERWAGIWLVRLGMLGIAAILAKREGQARMPGQAASAAAVPGQAASAAVVPGQASSAAAVPGQASSAAAALGRVASAAAVLGLLGAVTLSEQTVLPLDDSRTGTWIILSMVLLFSVLFYRLNRQREMEQEIARLKQEQAEILERDYQALRRTYADNAKLYHDLHNHIEAIYQCLREGDMDAAARYCEDLRAPVREISQTAWTGDKAVDYLISSKLALAGQKKIRTKVSIEYPRNTNIRSVDLTAVLGNLLDNALEAAETAPDSLRFLKLTIRRIHAMLLIKVENGCGRAPIQEGAEFPTTKEEKALHGWGLKSAQTAVERYDGTICTEYIDGVFQAVATLGFQPVHTPTLQNR